MKQITLTVHAPEGFDAHSIALLVQTANRFESSVKVSKGAYTMNAKSIMGMAALGICDGCSLTLEISGNDENEATEELERFLTTETLV